MIKTMIEITFVLIAHSVVGICSSDLRYSKKVTYIVWGIWILLQGGLQWYAEFVLTTNILKFLTGFFLPLAAQYTIFFFTTKGKRTQRVFTLLTYSIFFCIFMCLYIMVTGTFENLPPVLSVAIHGSLLAGILTYFIRYVCPLCHDAEKNITKGWSMLIFVNIVFLITLILSSVFPTKLTTFADPSCATFIFLSISIMAVYPVIFSNIHSMSEASTKREVEAQNKLLLAQLETENAQIAAAHRVRHDRRHHNLVMLEYANNNDIESVREYLKQLVESEDEAWTEEKYCENTTVNTVLSVYKRRAKDSEISVKISAHVSTGLDILPQDLVIVIANLFENAIHATEKIRGRKKLINISIRESVQRLLIKVENPCKENMVFDPSLYGIGICSVIATTDKYDGMYDFTAEDGTFSAKISLNLK